MKNRVGEIGYNNQGEKIIIIRYGGANDIDVQFEDGVIVYHRTYDKFKIGRIKHPIRYEESFAYHIEVELGIDLDNIWNWDKNNELGINPYEITKCSNKKVWLYCLKHDYHNYSREGNKIGYEVRCNDFYNNKRCGYCHTAKVHWKDSLAYNYPEIAKMIAMKENNLTFDDCYNIACQSNKKFYFKCDKCGMISNKKYSLNQIKNYGYSCKYCSDGISIPNKFMANILKQLNIDFKTELNKSDFKWCESFRYDFYLPKYNMIIEINGEQHYIENATNNWKPLEQEQWNDLFKYKCVKGYIDNYIVIDCRYSTLEWMKENVTKELSDYFDLSNIDWISVWEKCQNSLCVEAWELWNNGLCISDIVNKLNSNRTTIRKYLKQGAKYKKCSYSIENSRKITKEKIKGKNNPNSRQVIYITTDKIFDTIVEASNYYCINRSYISSCCKRKRKSAGKLKDGTKLIWMYYEDYLKQKEEIDEI